ncbi:MAG: RNA 2',3'-cyclic phosphodiesterase [Deltaproteobacteria bacterium]|nr:RNA 2',3'-cyclic phosphodiesterase [Deltaproteobacteria bacterium]
MSNLRLFTAISVPETIQNNLIHLAPPKARLEKKFHLTLNFIGNVPSEKLETLIAALESIKRPSFVVKVEGIGLFKYTMWAGARLTQELSELKKAVDLQVQSALGLELEKTLYKPHLTIARLKLISSATREIVEANKKLVTGEFKALSFGLWRSHLEPKEARRTIIKEFPLEDGPEE